MDPNQSKEWLLLQHENMIAVGEWLSCLWSWLQGLKAKLPQGAKSVVTSLKRKLALESFPLFAFLCPETRLERRGSPSALDSPTPHFRSSECSLK